MALVVATKKVEFVMIGLRGPTKAGKTVTGAMEAIYLAKKYHPKGTPVAFIPTEPGIDFVLDMFAKEGVPVLEPEVRSRSFATLESAIPDALKAGCGVLLIDNLTHFRDELVQTYKREHKITRKLKPFEYGPINDMWNSWTSKLLVAGIDKVMLGRIGNIFEELEDEEGETELKTIGTQMKAGNQTEYEFDLLIEMSSRPDPDAPNAVKVQKFGKPDAEGARKVVGRKLKRIFTANKLHIMTVADGRISSLNGQSLVMKPYADYKAGFCDMVGEFLSPYTSFVKSGTKGTQDKVVDLKPGTGTVFAHGESNGSYARKIRIVESWKTTLEILFPGTTAISKQRKLAVNQSITDGIRSTKEFEQQPVETLEYQYLILQKLEGRLKQEGTPDKIDELLSLVELARLEANSDWAVFHPPQPVNGAAVETDDGMLF